MLVYGLVVLLSSVAAIALFWLIVIGGYWFHLGDISFFPESADPDPESQGDRKARLAGEMALLQRDLRDIMTPKDPTARAKAKAKAKREGKKKPKFVERPLTETGSAENRTNSQNDLAAPLEDNSDIWLCDGRPVWFAIMQLPFVVLVTACCSASVLAENISGAEYVVTPFAWASLSTLIVSLVIGFYAAETVQTNTVIGVYRFKNMCNGFLGEGLQFTVPFFERSEEIPFQTLVWGPQTGEKDDGFHIEGTAGVNTNPETGIFAPLLRGRWPITVIVQVTFHFKRDSKRAWWDILNRWSEVKELGEQIASTINAVLVTRVRELDVHKKYESSTEAMETLNLLQDELPEICGPLLLALQELCIDLPVLFERVQISGVKAGKELQELLRLKDEAWAKRFVEEKAGEAVRDRLAGIAAAFASLAPGGMGLSGDKLANAVMRISELEVQRVFAPAGGESGSFETLVRAFAARTVKDVTTESKKP